MTAKQLEKAERDRPALTRTSQHAQMEVEEDDEQEHKGFVNITFLAKINTIS